MEEELVVRRVMPHDLVAEQSVIGAVLIDNGVMSDVCDVLVEEDFYDPACREIFRAIRELYRDAAPVDPVTLSDKMKSLGILTEYRSPELFSHIIALVPTSANVAQYVKIVRDKSYARQIIKLSGEASEQGYRDDEEIEKLLNMVEGDIFRLTENYTRSTHDDGSMFDIMMSALESIEKTAESGGRITGVPSGFADLDRMTTGFHPSELILIAARPSMGKTALVLNIAEYVTVKKGIPAVMFSLEMNKVDLAKRLLSMNSHVDSQKIRTAQMSLDEWREVSESANLYANSNFFIDDTPGISLTQLRTKCRKLKAQHGIQIVFIDYLQLMTGDGRSNSRQEEIASISRGLKAIAREIECPVVALSQLNRGPADRNDKRPLLSDLRESGAIEQDADVVMFVHRDEYYTKDQSEEKGIAEIIIGKQRNGPIGTVKLRWIEALTKFANLERKKENSNTGGN